MLVSEYVEGPGVRGAQAAREAERDRAGEIVFRFGLVSRARIVAGDSQADNYLLCADHRMCLLDLGLIRDLDPGYAEGAQALVRAVTLCDAEAVNAWLGHVAERRKPDSLDPEALLAHLAARRRVVVDAWLPPATCAGRSSWLPAAPAVV